MKIAICIPAYGDTKARFTNSLGAMLIWCLSQEIVYNGQPERAQFVQVMSFGNSRVQVAREEIAERALAEQPDYLLWLDADQTFPKDTAFRLAAHDLPFVGCNYPKRNLEESSAANIVGGKFAHIEPKSSGVEPVDVIGFGVCLIKAEVFAVIPRPWFNMTSNGEDADFCAKAREAGIMPHVDHALSMEVGHIAEIVRSF